MTERVYVFAAILSQPFDLQSKIGSRVRQSGKLSRFRTWNYLPMAYVQYMRPDRGLNAPLIPVYKTFLGVISA